MKTRSTLLCCAIALACAGLNTACTDYQDELDALEYRISVLENLSKETNINLTSIHTLVNAMDEGDYITNVTPTEGGYIITFKKAGAITILNGKDGRNGTDAATPDIGLRQDTDGNYYWTLNGEWLLVGGQKVRANGHDGHDGQSSAPQIRINETTGEWEISVDGGLTWTSTGTKATGRDGRDGQDANPMINSVVINVNADGSRTVTITMGNGLTFTVPLIS